MPDYSDTSSDLNQDGTRQALIAAALVLFAENGFNGTSTRMLSEASGANVSAIPYYFGSKRGLYLAVVEHIVERTGRHFQSIKNSLNQKLREGDLSAEESLEAVKTLIMGVARLFVESDEPKAWCQIVVREQANPTEAFDILYDGQIKPMQNLMARLVAQCVGMTPTSLEVKFRCHALFGQILVFLVSRESVLRHIGVNALKQSHVKTIYQVLMSHTESCLCLKSD